MANSPLLPLHADRGARLAARPEGDCLLTYGDVPGEYTAATTNALVFDHGNRDLVAVEGPDAVDFLHRITTNRIKGLEPGDGNQGLLLGGKGKIVECFDVTRSAEGFLLSTPPGRGASLLTALDNFVFAEDLKLEDRSAGHAPLDLVGPGAVALLAGLAGLEAHCLEDLADRSRLEGRLGLSALAITKHASAGCPGFRLEVAPEDTAVLWDALLAAGATPGGLAIEDILRVEACVARFGTDIDDSVYPQEARLEEAFSLDKGCYIGQEVVAKIDTYGGLNKRLMVLAIDSDDPVPSGTRLERFDAERDEWRDLGVVTSWAYSFTLDGGAVLAFVKRRHQEPGTEFRLGSDPDAPTATIVELPLRPGSLIPGAGLADSAGA